MMAVDVGGTFTDVVAVNEGAIRTAKVSTNVQQVDAGVLAVAVDFPQHIRPYAVGLLVSQVQCPKGAQSIPGEVVCVVLQVAVDEGGHPVQLGLVREAFPFPVITNHPRQQPFLLRTPRGAGTER